jgi:hypothetical protein
VPHHRTLPGVKVVVLCPPEPDAYTESTDLRILVYRAGIAGDGEARDADAPSRTGDLHRRVEDSGRVLGGDVAAVAI